MNPADEIRKRIRDNRGRLRKAEWTRLAREYEDGLLMATGFDADQFGVLTDLLRDSSLSGLAGGAEFYSVLCTEFRLLTSDQIAELRALIKDSAYLKNASDELIFAVADAFARNLEPGDARALFAAGKAKGSHTFSDFGIDVLTRRLINRPA